MKCEKPRCSVRCPKNLCEKKDCPKCETVCAPAKCKTQCIAPKPKCTPLCEETKCDWKCKKPTTCPKPKCQLACEKPACEFKKQKCCKCKGKALISAVSSANANSAAPADQTPSFLELSHTMFANAQAGVKGCCPCK